MTVNVREHYQKWIQIVDKCNNNEHYKQIVLSLCKKDIIFFFNNFLFTYDPRTDEKILPFILYPFQERFVLTLEQHYIDKKSLLVEKSRDMGFSWLVLGWVIYHFLFDRGFSAGISSRKAHLVDNLGDMNSLIERARFLLEKLPKFLLNGWTKKDGSKIMGLHHKNMETSILGEAGDEIGRGGRVSVYILDEFAFVPRSSIVHAAVSQTSNMKIFGSTPNGMSGEFARLRWKTQIDRVTLHWKDHPNKTQEWYEEQKRTLDETIMAQEIDISYSKSAEGRVYKVFDVSTHAKDKVIYREYDPVFVACDWGIGDPTAVWFLTIQNGISKVFDGFEIKDTSIEPIFNKIFHHLDKIHVRKNDVAGWVGDPDGRNRNIVSGDSIASFIRKKYGIYLRYKVPNIIRNRILATRSMLSQGTLQVDRDLSHLIECFENYRYPSKDHGENESPIHDWTSHSMSAIEYYCDFYHGIDTLKQSTNIAQIRIM
jgi:hypothetical protein